MFKGFQNLLHHTFSRFPVLVKLFILIRNQCNAVIKYYLADSPDPKRNGENFIIDFFSKRCSLVVDVGANKGEWTRYFMRKNNSATFFLIEPSRTTFQYLESKFEKVANVVLINKAMGEWSGSTTFFEEAGYGETSSLVPNFSNNTAIETRVEVTTIDILMTEYNLKTVDFLKVDVEGFDFHVLKGARQSLKSHKILFMQFEYNKPWANSGSTLASAFNFLSELKYEVFLLRNDGLYEFKYDIYGEFYEYSNFVAFPTESHATFRSVVRGKI